MNQNKRPGEVKSLDRRHENSENELGFTQDYLKSLVYVYNSQFTFLFNSIVSAIKFMEPNSKQAFVLPLFSFDGNEDKQRSILKDRTLVLKGMMEHLARVLNEIVNSRKDAAKATEIWSNFHVNFTRRLCTLNYLTPDAEAKYRDLFKLTYFLISIGIYIQLKLVI